MRRWIATAVATACACALGTAPASALTPNSRYELVHGCYDLRSQSLGRTVATASGPFRMQATDLGRYLLYGRKRDFLAGGAGGAGGADGVAAAAQPSDDADWRVDVAGEAFTLTLPSRDRALATTPGGELVLVPRERAGRFTFERAQGCPEYPEVELNVTGSPFTGPQPYGEVRGFLETHMHWMGFRLSGGGIHCGRPWHRYGAPYALVDCPEHQPAGQGAIVENAANAGRGAPTHDPVGWPTFKDWPAPRSLTHEQAYYKWVERAWRSGLRLFVNKTAENGALCEVYPVKRHSCREMDGALLQIRDLYELQDYVDAQSGGPGKGWFRIVRDPFQARRVINQGKMAVVLGIEVSRLFDCRILNDVPQCNKAMIDHQLDGVYRLGVRDMQLINKFDNAFGGVAGDDGSNGVVTTNGHLYETRRFPEFRTCTGPEEDRPQIQAVGGGRDQLLSNAFSALLPGGGLVPVYPPPPHCNARGLTELGAFLAERMMERRMIIDPDHLSVLARSQLLSILEARGYSGTMSSHSWADYTSYRRMLRLGGVIGPASGPNAQAEFLEAWRKVRELRDPRYYPGMGFGADMRGLAPQPGARSQGGNPVAYPFKSFDGKVTIDRQRSGQRVFDVNRDGVAHYGLYPDWIEDQRRQVGDAVVEDLARGAEAYLQMWERAEGVPGPQCRNLRGIFTARGAHRIPLGGSPEQALRSAGQPRSRGRVWTWCVKGPNVDDDRRSKTVVVFTPGERVGLIASTAPGHKALNVGTGWPQRSLRRKATLFGRAGVLTRRLRNGARLVYGVRRGRVRYVAVASREAARSPARLRGYLRLAGVG